MFVRILLIALGVLSIGRVHAQEENIGKFLKQLRQEKLDSTIEKTSFYKNKKLKQRRVTYHSHYYVFEIARDEYFRRTSFSVEERFNRKGEIVEKDSLLPREMGWCIRKKFVNGKATERRLYYKGEHLAGKSTFKDCLCASYNDSIPQSIPARTTAPPQQGEKYYDVWTVGGTSFLRFGSSRLQRRYDDVWLASRPGYSAVEDLKLATIVQRRRFIEITIKHRPSDKIVCRLRLKYTNPVFVKYFQQADSVLGTVADNRKKIGFVVDKLLPNIIVYMPSLIVDYSGPKEKGKYILNADFERIMPEPVRDFRVLSQPGRNYLWVCRGKCGLYTAKGKNIIPPKHDWAEARGAFLKVKTDGKYACYDYDGNIVIPYAEDYDAFTVSHNIAVCSSREYRGEGHSGAFYVNLITKDTLKATWGFPFEYNFARASLNDGYGLMNTKGEWVIDPNPAIQYLNVTSDSLVLIELNNPAFELVSKDDIQYRHQRYNLKLPDSLTNRAKTYARFGNTPPKKYHYVLYNLKSKTADTIAVNLKVLDGLLDYNISLQEKHFTNGFIRVHVTGSPPWFYTFCSSRGELVNISHRYTNAKSPMNERKQAIVARKKVITVKGVEKEEEFWGVIDSAGNEIIPCDFLSYYPNEYGYIMWDGHRYSLINFCGEYLFSDMSSPMMISYAIQSAENPFTR
ncbi:WG repeat-containing protein [Chryseolinea lacunae]|uniref:WG repeat-containing protein n=1 Tax=Chryseolinea lacunae TaxID=2801331 RepID=A0ABS1L1A1_9BACT|nr:WG repeat-containing protein [Chryseolinea lacunae]MBL0745484.1 WG repeat-containing protein [Chryseolinea lacunae]